MFDSVPGHSRTSAPTMPLGSGQPAESCDWMLAGASIKQIFSQSALKSRQAELSARRARQDQKRARYTVSLYIHELQIMAVYGPNAACLRCLCVCFYHLHFRGDPVFLTRKTDWSRIFPVRVESVFILAEWDSHSSSSVKSLELILISKILVNLITSPNCHGSRL